MEGSDEKGGRYATANGLLGCGTPTKKQTINALEVCSKPSM